MAKAVKIRLKSVIGNAPKGLEIQVVCPVSPPPNGVQVREALIKAGYKVTSNPTAQHFEVIA